jgi:hypothetical protein
MGFLDRVKSGFNQAAGPPAALTLEVAPLTAAPGDALDYHITLTTAGPFKADALVIGVYGRERIRGATAVGGEAIGASGMVGGPAAREVATFERVEPPLATNVALSAGETFERRGRIALPADGQPTYHGVEAQHIWRVRAKALVAFGDDLVQEQEITIR